MNDAALAGICREALCALDALLDGEAPPATDLTAEATRCTARLRDALIERSRGGDQAARRMLPRANALLSELVAAEFPMVGARLERVKQAREGYRRLLGELDASLRSPS